MIKEGLYNKIDRTKALSLMQNIRLNPKYTKENLNKRKTLFLYFFPRISRRIIDLTRHDNNNNKRRIIKID